VFDVEDDGESQEGRGSGGGGRELLLRLATAGLRQNSGDGVGNVEWRGVEEVL
jgi:hypothetical protein